MIDKFDSDTNIENIEVDNEVAPYVRIYPNNLFFNFLDATLCFLIIKVYKNTKIWCFGQQVWGGKSWVFSQSRS